MLSGTDDYSYPSWIPQLCCQAFFYLPQVWTLLSFVMPLYLCPFPKLCLESLLGLLWLAFLKSLRQTKNSFWAFKSVTYFHNSTYLSVFLKMHINFFKAVHVHGKRIEQYSSKWRNNFLSSSSQRQSLIVLSLLYLSTAILCWYKTFYSVWIAYFFLFYCKVIFKYWKKIHALRKYI